MKYGYARVSSVGQDLTIQLQKLNEVGCDVIREEKVSGTSLKGRKEFETLMEFMHSRFYTSDTSDVPRLFNFGCRRYSTITI